MTHCPLMSAYLYKSLIWASVVLTLWMGLWFIRNPKRVIEKQIAVYRLFRWQIEPLSWEREMKLTKAIGMFAVIAAVATSLVLILRSGGMCGLK